MSMFPAVPSASEIWPAAKNSHRRQRITVEGMIVGLYRLHQADGEMDVTAFQLVQQAWTHRFDQPDLHIRPAFGVSMQECGKHTFHRLWCGRDFRMPVSARRSR